MPGIERRSQIDTETFKGLLIINGGGAVALLGLFSSILKLQEYQPLARAVLVGVVLLVFGLAFAVLHNTLRRRCSLAHERNDPPGELFGIKLSEPTICIFNWACMWVSLGMFVVAGLVVALVGLGTV